MVSKPSASNVVLVVTAALIATCCLGEPDDFSGVLPRVRRETVIQSQAKTVRKVESYNLERIFKALDVKQINEDGFKDYKRNLWIYLAKEFVVTDLKDFRFQDYETRGEFVKAFLEAIAAEDKSPPAVKEAIEMLLPYVRLTGPGAQPVDKKEVERD